MDPVTGEEEDRSRRSFTGDTGGLSVVFLRSGTHMGLSGVLKDLDRGDQESSVRSYCSPQAVPPELRDVPLFGPSAEVDSKGVSPVAGITEFIWKKRWDVKSFPYQVWGGKGP